MMFKTAIRTGIIMDEVDGIESKRECSASDLSDYINYSLIRQTAKIKAFNKGLKKLDKKKLAKVYVNENPIICICNFLSKSVTPLLKDVFHIKFTEPGDHDVLNLLTKINTIIYVVSFFFFIFFYNYSIFFFFFLLLFFIILLFLFFLL